MRRTLIAAVVVVAAVAAAGAAVAQSAQRFSDVPSDHEHFEAIEWAADAGLTVGFEDGTFRPDEPLPKWAALVFVERYYDQILQAEQSDDLTRGDMMVLLASMAEPALSEPADGLLGDTYSAVDVPVTSIYGVDLSGAPEFRFQAVSAHSDRDLSLHPVWGWMKLICTEYDGNEWFVRLTISGDASLPEHYVGLNVSLDGGPVRGIATVVHGHPHNNNWRVLAADEFVAWIAGGHSLKAITRFRGEGVSFDVSEFRLYRDLLPERCRW